MIRSELTLGIQNFQQNLQRATQEVRTRSTEMRKEMASIGTAGGGAGGGGLGAGMMGIAGRLLPAVGALAAFRQGLSAVSISMERARSEMALGAISSENVGDQLERLRDLGEMPGLGFDQVVQGTIRLQAVGLSAAEAEVAIQEFGNALALVGGGKEQLDGVLLALTQIVAKGKVTAEEINQIAERLPQIRALMTEAFGTADTEALQKMNLSTQDFIDGVVEAAQNLERATVTSAEAMSNLGDKWKDFMASVGDLVEPAMQPLFDSLSELLERSRDTVESIRDDLEGAAFSLYGVSTNAEARDYLMGRTEAEKESPEDAAAAALAAEANKYSLTVEQLTEVRERAAKEQERAADSFRAESTPVVDTASALRDELTKDLDRLAKENEREAEKTTAERERADSARFATMDPEQQMRELQARMVSQIGGASAGSREGILAAGEALRGEGRDGEAADVFERLGRMDAIAQRMGAAPARAGAGERGSFATLMDEIFGRGGPEQQLVETREIARQARETKNVLDKILVKMDEPPPRDVFSDFGG